jgi:hypothetical protein
MLSDSRVTFEHNSLVLNEHFNADGSRDLTKLNDTIIIDRRISEPAFRDTRDPYHLAQGGGLGGVHKGLLYATLNGRIRVPHATRVVEMAERERALKAAFDPYLCDRDSPATDGAYALDFWEPTSDTTNFPTGRMNVAWYVRPVDQPKVTESIDDLTTRLFSLGLVAADPRLYRVSSSNLVLSPGTASGDVTNLGNTRAPLRATIAMAGAGASNFTITRAGVSFILNLSGTINGDSIVVVFETCGPFGRGKRITKNGTDTFSLKTSTPSTWLDVPLGLTSFSISNHTNVTSCTLRWHSAWA